MKKILCICLSSTLQKTVLFDSFNSGDVNRSQNYYFHASGKALNSARVLNQLQKDCAKVICPVGSENKQLFLDLAKNDFSDLDFVEIPANTRECLTLLDKTHHVTTEVVISENYFNTPFVHEQSLLLEKIEKSLPDADGVLFSGSSPSCFQYGFVSTIARLVKQNNKFLLVDYCGQNLVQTLSVCTPDVIKINSKEYLETFHNGEYLSENQLSLSIKQKSLEFSNKIIVTRGSQSTFAADKGNFLEFPVQKVKSVNTTACGDAFGAGFIYEYLKTFDFSESLAKGSWCASQNALSVFPGSLK